MNQSEGGEAEKREQSEEELHAELEARRIDGDFSYLDKQAERELSEQSSVQERFADLQGKYAKVQETLKNLREAIMSRSHLAEDVKEKVDFQKLRDECEYIAHHAFAAPTEPSYVRMAQSGLTNAERDFQARYEGRATMMIEALRGEIGEGDPVSNKLAKEYHVDHVREHLDPGKVAELADRIEQKVKRLQEMKASFVETSAQKALPPESAEEQLEQYARMYQLYQKEREELSQVLKNVREAE